MTSGRLTSPQGNRHPLLFSPRELRGHGLSAAPYIQGIKEFDGPLARRGIRYPGEHRQQGDIFTEREIYLPATCRID
jgi:hypothetical protein